MAKCVAVASMAILANMQYTVEEDREWNVSLWFIRFLHYIDLPKGVL